jgi:hypothetical protein
MMVRGTTFTLVDVRLSRNILRYPCFACRNNLAPMSGGPLLFGGASFTEKPGTENFYPGILNQMRISIFKSDLDISG